jgi:chemotaxis protein MotB
MASASSLVIEGKGHTTMSIAAKYLLIAGSLLGSVALTSCVSQSSYDSLDAENAQLHNYIAAQRTELELTKGRLDDREAQLGESKGHVTRLQGAIKYTVESDLLFPAGSWKMSKEGKDVITKMADKLAPTQENKLVVNGYTDSTPIGDELEKKGIDSNQELSEKRAAAVRAFLITKGMAPDKIIAIGHGEEKPVSTNETAKGRSQNRRVELTLGT